jgi:hypothetical protein
VGHGDHQEHATDPAGRRPRRLADWEGRELSLPVARTEFAKIAGDQALGDFIRNAVKEIRHQQIVNALKSLAEALLLTLAAGAGAAAIARAAASLVAEAGSLTFAAVEIGVSAPINSLVQMALSGDGNASFGWTMLENGLMDFFTRALLSPLKNAETAARIEAQQIANLEHLTEAERRAASSVNILGTQAVAELVGGMASQWAARKLVDSAKATLGSGRHGEQAVSDSFALTAVQQGAAVGLGRFFHGRLPAWEAHRAQLEQTELGALPEARALFTARDAFFKEAERLENSPSPDPADAERLNQWNVELERQEHTLFQAHANGAGVPARSEPPVSSEVVGGELAKTETPASSASREAVPHVEPNPASGGSEHNIGAKHEETPMGASTPGSVTPEANATTNDHRADATKPRTWAAAAAGVRHGDALSAHELPRTPDNAAGVSRLREILIDPHIPQQTRASYLNEVSSRLSALEEPPTDLHGELRKVAYGSPDKYLRKGPKLSERDFKKLGGLKRALSLKWLCSKATPEFLERAAKLDGSISDDPSNYTWPMADKVVALVKAGQLEFDPFRDVNPAAVVGNWPPGASGWYFAATDVADGITPRDLMTQLATGPEYEAGFQIAEVPESLAVHHSHPDTGAYRPTALDLTLAQEGLLNPDHGEPHGRTNPQAPGQVSIREVVMPPMPLSALKREPLVTK